MVGYSLGNFWRQLALPGAASRSGHSPACSNGWYSIRGTYWLMLSEGHLTRGRFAAMLQRIEMLALPAS